ncbi:MAG: hypothetical protein WA160_10675 [Pseudobdellovibrio sp.]
MKPIGKFFCCLQLKRLSFRNKVILSIIVLVARTRLTRILNSDISKGITKNSQQLIELLKQLDPNLLKRSLNNQS